MSRSDLPSDIRRLEELAFRGWPALESRDFAGWRQRFSRGYTKRANSINALGRDARCDPEIISSLEAPYVALGQTPAWCLTPLAPPAIASLLDARGYRTIEHSLVQVCPLHSGFTADPEVRILPGPTPAWVDAFRTHSPVAPQHHETMERMLSAIAAPAGFALVEEAGGCSDQTINQRDQPCIQQAGQRAAGTVELVGQFVAAGDGQASFGADQIAGGDFMRGISGGEIAGDGIAVDMWSMRPRQAVWPHHR